MGRFQEGGVLTQKVSMALGAAVLIMMGVFLCCPFAADADAEGTYVVNVEASADFCGVNTSLTSSDAHKVTYTLSGDDKYYYSATLLDSSDVSSGKVNYPTGYLYSGSPNSRELTVTAPLASGDYTFTVKFYAADDSEMKNDPIAEKSVPLKVVDPIVLTYTLKNGSTNAVTFSAYFVIDGNKVDDSIQEVTVPANGTKDVTYNYYTKDVKDTDYYLETDSSIIEGIISGLGQDNQKTFYAHDSDYGVITTICIVVLVIQAIILFFIMRKPVVNKGKPKGRR